MRDPQLFISELFKSINAGAEDKILAETAVKKLEREVMDLLWKSGVNSTTLPTFNNTYATTTNATTFSLSQYAEMYPAPRPDVPKTNIERLKAQVAEVVELGRKELVAA